MPQTRLRVLPLVVAAVLGSAATHRAGPPTIQPEPSAQPSPTRHPPVPLALSEAWLAPDPATPVPPELQPFVAGARAFSDDRHPDALRLFADARLAGTELAGYATYFSGLAELKLSRHPQARARFSRQRPEPAESALAEQWALASAEAAELDRDPAAAVDIYVNLLEAGSADPPLVLSRLAAAAAVAGDRTREEDAILRLHAEYPASDEAARLAGRVADIRKTASPQRARELDDLELARADRLYEGGRYAEARTGFASVEAAAPESRDLVRLRLGQCDYHLRQYRTAAEQLQQYVSQGRRQPEARHYHALALRRLGRTTEYEAAAARLADEFPGNTWSLEALNSLASHFIIADQDARSIEVFERVLREYPTGRHAERAAWKVGWWRYRRDDFKGASTVFERAAATAPRSDYRPAWLYWSARARSQARDADGAAALLRLVVADYRNSYYGRLALEALGGAEAPASPPTAARTSTTPARGLPPTSGLIRALLIAGQYDLARRELEFARRTWGASPVLDATLAYAHTELGDLRRGTIYMKRAYPQYIAAGGERLPTRIRRIIFPLDYATLIATYSRSRGLDPALVSALIAQESAFQADAKSSANAYGLMQILPRTGRRLARQDGLRRFTTRMLIDPKVNVRLGTRYFAQLLDEFPGAHFALASYNAGESRVRQWRAERGPMPTDEFIDDIPFPETQGYVKRVLSMVEDYRELYGAELAAATAPPARSVAPVSKQAAPAAKTGRPRP